MSDDESEHWGYKLQYRSNSTNLFDRHATRTEWIEAADVVVAGNLVRFQDGSGKDVAAFNSDADEILGYEAVTVEQREAHVRALSGLFCSGAEDDDDA